MYVYFTALLILAVCALALLWLPRVLSALMGKPRKPTEERKGEGD